MRLADALPRDAVRCTVRRLSAGDLQDFQAYRNDPIVARYQGWSSVSDSQAQAFLEEMSAAQTFVPGDWVQLGIAESGTGRLVGDVGVRVSETGVDAEIGFTLKRSFQGRGLAREAVAGVIALVLEATEVHRVLAITDSRNTAACKLLRAVGMQLAGTDEVTFRGESCLEHTYALMRNRVA